MGEEVQASRDNQTRVLMVVQGIIISRYYRYYHMRYSSGLDLSFNWSPAHFSTRLGDLAAVLLHSPDVVLIRPGLEFQLESSTL